MGRIMLRIAGLLILLLVVGLATFYLVDGRPLPESRAYLESDRYAAEQRADGGFLFLPEQPNGRGLLIMHGALIEPQAYANTAGYFASRGYTVLVPRGGFTRLSILAVDPAADAMRDLGLNGWYTIGHSMGGMSSLEVISRNPDLPVRGAALWAASVPKDYSTLKVPMLFLWGDNDGLLPEGRFEGGKLFLPADVVYETINGANHKDFAMYGHQFFDEAGRLGWQEQIDRANRITLSFFDDLET